MQLQRDGRWIPLWEPRIMRRWLIEDDNSMQEINEHHKFPANISKERWSWNLGNISRKVSSLGIQIEASGIWTTRGREQQQWAEELKMYQFRWGWQSKLSAELWKIQQRAKGVVSRCLQEGQMFSQRLHRSVQKFEGSVSHQHSRMTRWREERRWR